MDLKRYNEKVIRDFQAMITQAHLDYQYYYNKVNELDKTTQDLLHGIELGTQVHAATLAKQLKDIRQERRLAKDISVKLEPLDAYYTANRGAINSLTNIIGDMRKYEKFMRDRSYKPKILKHLLIDKDK